MKNLIVVIFGMYMVFPVQGFASEYSVPSLLGVEKGGAEVVSAISENTVPSLLASTNANSSKRKARLPVDEIETEDPQVTIGVVSNNVSSSSEKVVIAFDDTPAEIVCSPNKLCDIQLEIGESVSDLHVGDKDNWLVSPAISGEPPNQAIHAIVKPRQIGLETSMVILTDRRVYRMTLKSSLEGNMPFIGFEYPAVVSDNAALENEVTEKKARSVVIEDINFDYRISGKEYPWRPVRVFDDGIKTFIELKEDTMLDKVPVILAGDGSSDSIVNYDIIDHRFVVDGVSKRLVLVKGIGEKQERITVIRE